MDIKVISIASNKSLPLFSLSPPLGLGLVLSPLPTEYNVYVSIIFSYVNNIQTIRDDYSQLYSYIYSY